MDFISIQFYIFLGIVVVLYYVVPLRLRWLVLLAGSLTYFALVTASKRAFVVFLCIILISWLFGILHHHLAENGNLSLSIRRLVLALSIAAVLSPLVISRSDFLLYGLESFLSLDHTGVLISIGLSFFTMQIIAYLMDIYWGRVDPQRSLLKYALFISFFPQLLQGPIPRYEQLEPQLLEGHRFDEDGFAKGFMLLIWGFFLKLMIADKAGVVVDTIFAEPDLYQGAYVLVGGVLYSIQLYADFLACVTMAQGAAALFGIHLADNFDHPYFSMSIKEFWGRWHISLSTWLRDYVYIPLGGNRKGKLRRYCNLCLTFLVSALWHGSGLKYLLWGMLHAAYQITGELTLSVRDAFFERISIPKNSRKRTLIRGFFTFWFVMLAWIVFRADTINDALLMLRTLFTIYNPWIFFDDSLLELGLSWKEWDVLFLSGMVLLAVSILQEHFVSLCDRILAQPFYLRLLLYISAIAAIFVFGTYGYGYNAADFIYGGF